MLDDRILPEEYVRLCGESLQHAEQILAQDRGKIISLQAGMEGPQLRFKTVVSKSGEQTFIPAPAPPSRITESPVWLFPSERCKICRDWDTTIAGNWFIDKIPVLASCKEEK